jgi:hypothetical protein
VKTDSKIRRPPTWLVRWALGCGLPEDATATDIWFLACSRLGFDVNLLGAAAQQAIEAIGKAERELAAARELEVGDE